MAERRHREEVINVKFADLLSSHGFDADAETIHSSGRPDVLVDLGGVRLIIEGRHEKQARSLHEDAKKRVRSGMGEIGLAIEYPDHLFETPSTKLEDALRACQFAGAAFCYQGTALEERSFEAMPIEQLATLIGNFVTLIVQNDVVNDQVDQVEAMIDEVVSIATRSNLFFKSDTVRRRLMDALAIDED